ncbi:MAG: helicase-related protein [Bacillota bacterium]|nr:helicase-related protein [Bacillota bacterium]
MTPATLRECSLKISYGPSDDRLNEFYIPVLSVSVRYDRAAGFFSSSALSVAAQGIAKLIQNGGRMRLLVGAELSEEDVEAIRKGAEMSERLTERLMASLTDPVNELQQRRLEALAWMVADGTLEIKVVLPKGPDGHPLPANESHDYYHPKEGIFTDAAGDQVSFNGSVNESMTAWEHNYEQFAVYMSWNESRPYLMGSVRRFERLWEGAEHDWIAVPAPQAVRERLVRLRPSEAPTYDPLEDREKRTRIGEKKPKWHLETQASQRERIIFQFLRDAPYLVNAGNLAVATSAVKPWPHQLRVVEDVVDKYPQSFLLCDEVGLGKTIEAGLILRQLSLSGRARRCLLLVPAGVARQWQEELYEKFALNVPFYDGFRLTDYFRNEIPISNSNPWNEGPLLLASSHLAKRRERQLDLLEAEPWDLVIVDEAHHARRREYNTGRYRENRLLELLASLRERARCMLFLTATPMQVSPVEIWDLLKLLGMGGKWGASDRWFVQFFQELGKTEGERDWVFLFEMLRDYFQAGGKLDKTFAEVAERRIGPVEWRTLVDVSRPSNTAAAVPHLSPQARELSVELLRRHTPLQTFLHRNTRGLLRRYQTLGILKENVPSRRPEPVWIEMQPDEATLYERVEDYVSHFYEQYERQRKGLGFVMTVYRRRLTSSFYALEQSLRRRLAFLRGEVGQVGTDNDDVEQADLDDDVTEELEETDRSIFAPERSYVEDFLREITQLKGDSKFEQLCADLNQIFEKRETVVVFTQYTDTMDYLRGRLSAVYGSLVACYSGRGGEYWNGAAWVETTKEEIKGRFREGIIKILVCTEAASEGLNLQTCGVLINYDMPWNPMRVEQRIGRIDRIGQVHDVVWVRHYFYKDTVEAVVYSRLADRIQWFELVVGELQPILARVGRVIEHLALTGRDDREPRLQQVLESLQAEIDERKFAELDLDKYSGDEPGRPREQQAAVSLQDLEHFLCSCEALAGRFKPHPSVEGAHVLSWNGCEQSVTFRRGVFEEHPVSVRLLTYGDEMLEGILSSIGAPEGSHQGSVGRICVSGNDVELRSWMTQGDERLQAMCDLAELESALNKGSHLEVAELEGQARAVADVARTLQLNMAMVEEGRRDGAFRALQEEARQVLLRVFYIQSALSQKAETPSGGLVEFSPEAIGRLGQQGYPFAGLLRLVPLEGVRPSPSDPDFLQVREASVESLRAKYQAERQRAVLLLKKLADWTQAQAQEPSAEISVELYLAEPP